MSEYCVIVAARACARLFSFQSSEMPQMVSGPNLVLEQDLSCEESTERSPWSENKSGRNRSPGGAGAHGYDDHRNDHEQEFERRFANRISDEALKLLDSQQPRKLVLVAQNRMLGYLRRSLESVVSDRVQITEVSKDLCHLSSLELHDHLAKEGWLPARRKPPI